MNCENKELRYQKTQSKHDITHSFVQFFEQHEFHNHIHLVQK